MSEAKRVPENYHSEKADVAALKKHLRYWNKLGWNTLRSHLDGLFASDTSETVHRIWPRLLRIRTR